MSEHKTTMGSYHWRKDERGGGEWVADDPIEPEGDGWVMEGSGMQDGVFAWFWVRQGGTRDI